MTIALHSHLLHHYRHIERLLTGLDARKGPWAAGVPGAREPRGDIVVFPGSFNPPTLAHLAMLREARTLAARRFRGRWQVYAALSRQIVDKEAVERMTQLDRVVLLEGLLARYVRHAGVLLLNRGLYVEQAQGIHAAFPSVRRLCFLVGFDKIVQILDPRYYAERDSALRELFKLAQLLVAPRGQDGELELRVLLERPENRQFARYIHPLALEERYRDVSSTEAREAATLEIVPREVLDFIQRTRPYEPAIRQGDGSYGHDRYAERTRALRSLLATGSAGT